MLCGQCDEESSTEPCESCGESPRLDGRYCLEAVVGRGANGVTYRARAADETVVAIKELPFRAISDLKALELFRREAEVLRQIDHPAVPSYVDHFTSGIGRRTSLYIVQEFVEGEDLRSEMANRRYSDQEVKAIVGELLDVLEYLHGLSPPIIHRDIKPSNVMRRSDGSLALIDFGSVRDAIKDPSVGGSTIAGTFGYMAPEQFRGDATPATDLYSLGAFTVMLMTRHEPQTMLDSHNRIGWQRNISERSPAGVLLAGLLAHSPDDRVASAAAARRLLEDPGSAIVLRPRSQVPATQPARHLQFPRMPAPVAVGFGGILAAGGATVLGVGAVGAGLGGAIIAGFLGIPTFLMGLAIIVSEVRHAKKIKARRLRLQRPVSQPKQLSAGNEKG